MPPRSSIQPSRERILDAAFEVMHAQGLVNATTKRIALRAGYSEAMLYKHFSDKQEIFLAVLQERVPPVRISAAAAGDGDLVENLATLIEDLMAFFVTAFPIAASIFSSPILLREHRTGIAAQNSSPEAAVRAVEKYLEAERTKGRINANANCASAARLLVGAAFHQGFLAAFAEQDAVPNAPAIAMELVQTLTHGLS